MNVPAPKLLVEKTWEGRVFGGDWRSAAGGSLDVMEPATGNKLTSVGNASAADIRKAAAEAQAPRSPAGRQRRTRSAPPCCARPPARSKTIRKN